MATFLELCAKLARESGAVGAAPSAVTDQTGRQDKCVQWIAQAWEQIQADNPDWTFLRTEFSGALSIGAMNYTPAAFGIDDFARWLGDTEEYQPMTIYASGAQANEVPLSHISYQSWRSSFNRGAPTQMKPIYWSVAPDRSLLVGPPPDAAYIVRGEYQRGPQTLAANDDVPIMPEQYHDAIVWRAAMMLASHDEAPVAFQSALGKYGPILMNMERDLLPAIELGGNALA